MLGLIAARRRISISLIPFIIYRAKKSTYLTLDETASNIMSIVDQHLRRELGRMCDVGWCVSTEHGKCFGIKHLIENQPI